MDKSIQYLSELMELKVNQFTGFFHNNQVKLKINTALAGAYIEELVRCLIKIQIGTLEILHGTLYKEKISSLYNFMDPEDCEGVKNRNYQIDGILYDCKKGFPAIREGDFIILDCKFCAGIVEIKSSCKNLGAFYSRLINIRNEYCMHLKNKIFGVVIKTKLTDDQIRNIVKPGNGLKIFHLFHITKKGLELRKKDFEDFCETILKLND